MDGAIAKYCPQQRTAARLESSLLIKLGSVGCFPQLPHNGLLNLKHILPLGQK